MRQAVELGDWDPSRHCTTGDAHAALQALENGYVHWNPFEGDVGQAGLGAWFPCQYRLWARANPVTGNHWMFCEDDVFLGGSASPYPLSFCADTDAACDEDADCAAPCEEDRACDEPICIHLSTQEIAAEFDTFLETAEFGPVGGSLEEPDMIRTAYRSANDPYYGQTFYFQTAFITQRPPGWYRSVFKYYVDANGDGVWERGEIEDRQRFRIEVVSHEEHLRRVAAGAWK